MGKYFWLYGDLPFGHTHVTSGSELLGEYVHHTRGKVEFLLKHAFGGVLFIDEFYNIMGDNLEKPDLGGVGSLVALIQPQDLKCIIVGAGYEYDVYQVFKLNEGLARRFLTRVEFKSFSHNELAQIFLKHLQKSLGTEIVAGKTVDQSFIENVKHVIAKNRISWPAGFGEAGAMIALAEKVHAAALSSSLNNLSGVQISFGRHFLPQLLEMEGRFRKIASEEEEYKSPKAHRKANSIVLSPENFASLSKAGIPLSVTSMKLVDPKHLQTLPSDLRALFFDTTALRQSAEASVVAEAQVLPVQNVIAVAADVTIDVANAAAAAEAHVLETEPHWNVGMIMEAEMMDPRFPLYTDTIHPVQVNAVLSDREYRCRLLAFGGINDDVWGHDLLHEIRGAEEDIGYAVGDRVHIRMRNRKVHGESVDGLVAKEGIWVKGIVHGLVEQDGKSRAIRKSIKVQHVDWKDETGKTVMITSVSRKDIRSAFVSKK